MSPHVPSPDCCPSDDGSIDYYVEPEPESPEFLTSPGVTSAWFLLDGEYVPVAIISGGDGKANVMRTDLE